MEPIEPDYRIEYVPPWIVRCDDDLFCLEYIDAQGTVSLKGFEKPHPSGGLLYFPDAMEWDYCFPDRKGQRDSIRSHLLEWLLKEPSHAYLAPSLVDGTVYRRPDAEIHRLRPPPPLDLSRELPPKVKKGYELLRQGYEILKQKGVSREELTRAIELTRSGLRMLGLEKGDDKPK